MAIEPRKTRVAVAQLNSNENVERNMAQAENAVRAAAAEGAALVMLPECFAYLGPEEGKLAIAESLDESGPILSRCREWAVHHNAEIILGGFWENSPESRRVFNACVHLSRTGEVLSVYRKRHLFDVALDDGTVIRESDSVMPGDAIVTTNTDFGVLGLSVCYDVRFPELYRALIDEGATSLAIPAAFTQTTGKAHWQILLRARAIENQAYVLAAAQTGHHFGRRRSYGHAMIIDPWGEILADAGEEGTLAVAEVDPDRVKSVRRQLPSLTHRRD